MFQFPQYIKILRECRSSGLFEASYVSELCIWSPQQLQRLCRWKEKKDWKRWERSRSRDLNGFRIWRHLERDRVEDRRFRPGVIFAPLAWIIEPWSIECASEKIATLLFQQNHPKSQQKLNRKTIISAERRQISLMLRSLDFWILSKTLNQNYLREDQSTGF